MSMTTWERLVEAFMELASMERLISPGSIGLAFRCPAEHATFPQSEVGSRIFLLCAFRDREGMYGV